MESMNFLVKNKIYKVLIKKSKIKRLYLRVKNEEIIASVPLLAPKKIIREFIEKNIEKCISYLEKRKLNSLYSIKENFIFLRGKKCQIIILLGFKKNNYEIVDNKLYLKIKKGTKIEELIKEILKEITFKYVTNKIHFFEQKMNLKNHDFIVSYKKSSWGTNFVGKNKISFSSRLSHFEEKYTDYIIVHELSHSIHANHSKDFWKIVEKFKPNFKELKKKFKNI